MPEGSWHGQAAAFRLPPSNPQAEQALLGAILANNKAYHSVSEFLLAEHFSDPVHARIFERAAARIEQGQLADAVTLKADFLERGVLDEVGGTAYLTQLLSAMVGILNASDYGRSIYECWQRRTLIENLQGLLNDAYDGSTNIVEIANNAATCIDGITVSHTVHPPTSLADAIAHAITAGEAASKGVGLTGVRTGLAGLDEALGDWEESGVYIIGGRPGGGKSALALQIAIYNALRRVPVAYFSTEMQEKQLGRRAAAFLSGVPSNVTKRGGWTDWQKRELEQAWADANAVKAYFSIEDAPGLNMRFISNRARTFARRKAVEAAAEARRREAEELPAEPERKGLVVVDHIHDLEEMSESEMKGAIGTIMRAGKRLSKQLGWPVLFLAQMNRGIDTRENRQPELSDFYGGMQIEAIAEAALLLHRPEQGLDKLAPERKASETEDRYNARYAEWEQQWQRLKGVTRGYLPKNRDNASGQVFEWEFDGARNKFSERRAEA